MKPLSSILTATANGSFKSVGRFRIWLLRALAVLSILAVILQFGLPQSRVLTDEAIQGPDGWMYHLPLTSPLPLLQTRDDTNTAPRRSKARLLEDGKELGPAHTLHANIIANGGGGYSHYQDYFYFSTSDNSDPRQNGRTYTLQYQVYPSVWLTLLVILVFGLVVLASIDRSEPRAGLLRVTRQVFFGLSPLAVLVAACGLGLLMGGVMLFAVPDIAAKLFKGLRRAIEEAAVFGLSFAAGALLIQSLRNLRSVHRHLLQCVGLVLLAYGISDLVVGPVQYWGMAMGVLAALPVIAGRDRRYSAVSHLVSWWTALEAADERKLVRRIILASMVACLIVVLPEVIRYWDESGWWDSASYDLIAHRIAAGTEPLGSSYFMPVYQYGLATFYWAFGHFFFVQQIVNVALATFAVGIMTTSAWLLFRRAHAVLIVAVVVVCWEQFHHVSWRTQIEGWYIPIFAASILALLLYIRRPGWKTLVLLALAAALVFNTRLQGAFYAAALGLSVFFIFDTGWRRRAQHVAVFFLLFLTLGILPWSLRNWVEEGRFSPSSTQSAILSATLNDPRTPLYGIRYWEVPDEVNEEWKRRYPDEAERIEAQRGELMRRLMTDPGYFVEAAPWRAMAFYGLLPPGTLETVARQADWENELWPWLDTVSPFMALLLLSALGVLARPRSRFQLLFAGLIAANLLVGLSVGSAESRISYPPLLLHLLMGTAVFAPFALGGRSQPSAPDVALPVPWGTIIGAIFIVLLPTMIAAHLAFGRTHQFRPIMSNAWRFEPAVAPDSAIPRLDPRMLRGELEAPLPLKPGTEYRASIRVLNLMMPPPSACCWRGFDRRLHRNGSVQYFIAHILGDHRGDGYAQIALRFEGAVVTGSPLEDSVVDGVLRIEADQDEVPSLPRYWAVLRSARTLKPPPYIP
ncbi:hypothetical protein [Afifella pfennigii]|uniref:hypothetical protein n=1 Tax=Afifella pfennigii TaxID=209897 RepID=UPI0005507D12|nr:hypothetical protein [Afifella pfennigii]